MTEDYRFFLNMQIVADGFEGAFPGMEFYPGEDASVLEGAAFYEPGTDLEENCVYIAQTGDLAGAELPDGHIALILTGGLPDKLKGGRHSVITLPEGTDLKRLMNACQEVFMKNRDFAAKLRNIAMQDGSVDELCEEGYRYFQNPLFVHDSRLNLISCPVRRKEMIQWELDAKSGLLITPQDDLNELKTDREYRATLYTKGAQIYSADLRGYRDIYVNIWNEYGDYEGRVVICELDTPLKKGQMAAAEYFEKIVRLTLSKRRSTERSNKRALEAMLLGLLKGKDYGEQEIQALIGQTDWKPDDEYICICMDSEEREGIIGSAVSVCNHVEGRIEGGRALVMGKVICVIINRTLNKTYASEMPYILRDGLFKAGYSSPFKGIQKLERHYRQASIALEYCKKRNDMRWHYTFDEIAPDYIADKVLSELGPEELCADELKLLKEYDAANNTELYRTLKTYILNERNTVATSKELFIGRSTLFYRLRKIKEVTGLDTAKMSDPERNLYLRLSVYIMERQVNL